MSGINTLHHKGWLYSRLEKLGVVCVAGGSPPPASAPAPSSNEVEADSSSKSSESDSNNANRSANNIANKNASKSSQSPPVNEPSQTTPIVSSLEQANLELILSQQNTKKIAFFALVVLVLLKLAYDFIILFPKHRDNNLYGLLGVNRFASEETVHQGFKRMAKLYHPDKVASSLEAAASATAATLGSPEKFLMIKFANDALLEPVTRNLYNRFGSDVLNEYMLQENSMRSDKEMKIAFILENLKFRMAVGSIWLLITWTLLITIFTWSSAHARARSRIWAVFALSSIALFLNSFCELTVPVLLHKCFGNLPVVGSVTEFELNFIIQSLFPIAMAAFSFLYCINFDYFDAAIALPELFQVSGFQIDMELSRLQEFVNKSIETPSPGIATMITSQLTRVGSRLLVNVESSRLVAQRLAEDAPTDKATLQYLVVMALFCGLIYGLHV